MPRMGLAEPKIHPKGYPPLVVEPLRYDADEFANTQVTSGKRAYVSSGQQVGREFMPVGSYPKCSHCGERADANNRSERKALFLSELSKGPNG